MMDTAESGKRTIGIWTVVCILMISICVMVSLLQVQNAYAEKKKVVGTSMLVKNLARLRLAISHKTEVRIISSLYVLSSTDPDWNNASYHPVSIIIDPTGEGDDYTVLAVITHQGGDQTFLRSDGMLKFIKQGEFNWSGESNGYFLGGTGKFEDIRARWKYKVKGVGRSKIIGDWEVEYF